MSRPVLRAVLFADLAGSTRLYDEKGDEDARRITAACVDRMSELVRKHTGRVVKTIGDEVLATFESAERGLRCADSIAAEFSLPNAPMQVHVGLHCGSVIEEDGDVFGDTVNVAARLVSLAVDGEVLISRNVRDSVDPEWRRRMRPFDRRTVKGKHEELEIHSVIQVSPEMTTVQAIPGELRPGPGRLVLRVGDRAWIVDDHHPDVSIGRAEENDLVISEPWVSRHHARVLLRHGKYVIADESSNGTWVERHGARPTWLHREEMILPVAGRLGARPDAESDLELPVAFEIVDED